MIRSDITFPGLGLTVDPPRGFEIGGFTIYFYGVIIALGLVLAVVYAMRRSKQFGLKNDDLLDGILWIVPLAIVCARAYYVFSEWDKYADNLGNIINLRNGGLAIYGGVIGAAVGVVVFAKFKKVSLRAVLDLVALGFLIGQCVGRWGNFMNREAFGSYSDGFLAMRIPESYLHISADASEAFLAQVEQMKTAAIEGGYAGYIQVHPTFLYESVWNFVGFIGLHFLSKKRSYDGQIALGYVAWYGLGRALIEGLRMDSLYWGPFRASQLLAAVTCIAAVVVLLLMNLRKHDRQKLFVNRVAAAAEAAAQEAAEETAEEEITEAEETVEAEETAETEE